MRSLKRLWKVQQERGTAVAAVTKSSAFGICVVLLLVLQQQENRPQWRARPREADPLLWRSRRLKFGHPMWLWGVVERRGSVGLGLVEKRPLLGPRLFCRRVRRRRLLAEVVVSLVP